MACGIYRITAPDGLMYIGKAKNIDSRWDTYKNLQCENQPRLYQSLIKHGYASHQFEILERCHEFDLFIIESYYITLLNTTHEKIGLNMVGSFRDILWNKGLRNFEDRDACIKIIRECRNYISINNRAKKQFEYFKSVFIQKRSIVERKIFHKQDDRTAWSSLRDVNVWLRQNDLYYGNISYNTGVVPIKQGPSYLKEIHKFKGDEFDYLNGIMWSYNFEYGDFIEICLFERKKEEHWPHQDLIIDNNVKVKELPKNIHNLMIKFSTEGDQDNIDYLDEKIYRKVESYLEDKIERMKNLYNI